MVKASNVAVKGDKAEKKVEAAKVPEKVAEKRRALGRGLSALLPPLVPPLAQRGAVEAGPRVVGAAAPARTEENPLKPKEGLSGAPTAPSSVAVVATQIGESGEGVGAPSAALGMTEGKIADLRAEGEEERIPPFGRNDNAEEGVQGPLKPKPGFHPTEPTPGSPGTPASLSGAPAHDTVAPLEEVKDEVDGEAESVAIEPPAAYPAMGTHIRGHVLVPAAEVEEDARRAAAFHPSEPTPGSPGTPAGLSGAPDVVIRAGDDVIRMEIDLIDDNPYQTRRSYPEQGLKEMAQSIRVQGVLQPVVVRPSGDGRYRLILGERRLRASRMAGIETVPAIVKRVNEQQAAEMTLVENLQRQDLNCLEQAEAFSNLSTNFNLTQEEIGKRVGMSREAVANYMRLLKLPSGVLEALVGGRLTYSHARALMPLRDEAQIWTLAQRAMEENLTVSELENVVNGIQVRHTYRQAPKGRLGARWLDPNVKAAQRSLEEVLGMRVRISDRRGRGKIVIQYESLEDFDRVVRMLRGK